MEVYFGPPKLMGKYIKTCCLSIPAEMKALRDARDELARSKTALASEMAKLATAERSLQFSNCDLLAASSKISEMEVAISDRTDRLAEMTAARNRWRKAALSLLGICMLGLWLLNRS